MAWIYLTIAGLFEVGWAIGLKYTEGFTRLWPSLWTVACMVASLALLGAALAGMGFFGWKRGRRNQSARTLTRQRRGHRL